MLYPLSYKRLGCEATSLVEIDEPSKIHFGALDQEAMPAPNMSAESTKNTPEIEATAKKPATEGTAT